jgi:hypothetical protein
MPSPVREVLEGYVTGRVRAERVVAAVAAAYYGSAALAPSGDGEARHRLRPVVDVIERASPGVVALSGSSGRPGFDVRLAERPFPPDYEPALRHAAAVYLAGESFARPVPGQGTAAERAPGPPPPPPPSPSARRGLIARLAGIIQRLFSARA